MKASTNDRWLTELPSHWDVRRNGRLFSQTKLNGRDDLPILTVSIHNGVTVRDMEDNKQQHTIEDRTKYKQVQQGDIAYNMMRMWQGAVGIAPTDGLVSPAYVTACPLADVNAKYYEYLFRTSMYMGEVEGYSRGIVSDRNRLYWEEFKQIPSPYPPCGEQQAIVAFLDHKLAMVNRFIESKRRLIRLLEESLESRISHLLINTISEDWTRMPLKYAFDSMEYGISDSGTNEGTIPVLKMGDIQAGSVRVPDDGGVHEIDPSLLVMDGDLLFNRTNSIELVGKVGLYRDCGRPVTFASYLVRLRAKPNMDSRFLNYLLNSSDMLSEARMHAIPSLHQANLNPTRYGRLNISVPSLGEQQRIATEIETDQCNSMETISRIESEINLIQEFRSSLIAEAVTGKIDVRLKT